MNLLGIDMGTTSVKTAVFDEKLNQKMQTTADYTLESKGDRVEFESEKYWEIVSGEIKKIKKELEVDALAIDTQCETHILTDENGNVTEVLATYDPDSKGGDPADGRKIKGATIHWVDAKTCCEAEVRQYANLFDDADPDASGKDFLACLNPNSLEVLTGCKVEASLASAEAPSSYQFMRLGYFCPDSKDSKPGHLVFNRSVSLKDSFKPTK